jgi:NADH:ubiquinone oxidoreductase subunit 4 (subunit M)
MIFCLVTIIVIVISNIYVVWFVKQELYEKIKKNINLGGGVETVYR